MAHVGVKFKIVTEVRRAGSSEAALRDYCQTTIRPHLEDILRTQTAVGYANRVVTGEMRAYAVPGVANRYYVYPKLFFEADTVGLTRTEVIAGMNAIADLMASQITTDLVAGGGTVIAQVRKLAGGQVTEAFA